VNLRLRAVEDRDEALALAPRLDACAIEVQAEFRDEPLPEGVGRRFVERHLGRREALLLVAEESEGGELRGLCAVAPLEDPLTGEVTPLVALLFVDRPLRHRGVARALVQEARRLLGQRGLRTLAARAGHNDDALISMGERWGFVRAWELLLHEG
jgi:GNAT superfamily N-acetyltransferase